MDIEAIIKKIELRPDYYPKSTDKESALLLTTISRMIDSKYVIEIGTYLGYGTLHLLLGMKNPKHIWTVDWKPQQHTYFHLLPENLKHHVLQIYGTSAELKKYVPKKTHADIIFIDANHTYAWVLHDLHYVLPYIKSGTIILFHDALNPKAPGVHTCTRLFHLVNFFSINRALEIIHIPTSLTQGGETSGVGIVRIKTHSAFLIRFTQQFFSMLFRIHRIRASLIRL